MSDKTPTPPQREAMMIATSVRELAMYVDLSVFKGEAFDIVIDMLNEDEFGRHDELRHKFYRALLEAMEAALDRDAAGEAPADDGPFGSGKPPAWLRVVKDDDK